MKKIDGGNINNRDICLYVLKTLGGENNFIPTEDIAVRAFEIYPSRFGLIKYPQYPDITSVHVTLTDLQKKKYNSLIEGNKNKGWKITDNGKKWLIQNSDRIKLSIEQIHPLEKRVKSGSMITRKKIIAAYKKRVQDSIAYIKWTGGESISIYEFFDVLHIDQYTPENTYRKKLNDMFSALDSYPEYIKFLTDIDKQFGQSYRGGQ